MRKTKAKTIKKTVKQPVKLRPDEIAFWGRFISKVKDPEEPQDVATKKYVDENAGGGGATYTAGANITIENNVISATDTKYTAGSNVSISDENVISATDTTYSNFTGTDGTAAGTAGLVPAPATTDAGKFLKADGTWDTAGGGGGGIPTDAKFWGINYDSTNNRVEGNILLANYYIGRQYTHIKTDSQAINFYVNNATTPKMQLDINTLNLESHKIIGVVDPTNAQDAATKNYVDSFYPVGTVYSSTSSTAPTFAGGTWTEIGTQTIGSATVHYYERTA